MSFTGYIANDQKHRYQLDEDDVNALGIILPSLAKRDEQGNQIEQGRLEGRAAQVCLRIFNTIIAQKGTLRFLRMYSKSRPCQMTLVVNRKHSWKTD